jgi:hypothetical protein
MSVEVPPHVEEILGPYPELTEQWKAEMGKPCMQEWNYEGSVKRMLDPVYLRRVAFEHRQLVEGNIERPEPQLAAAIEAALRLHAGVRKQREEDLNDPWWRAMFYDSNCIANYYDPKWLREFAEECIARETPFSPQWLELRRALGEFEAGGTFEVSEIATGEVVNTFTVDGSRHGAAPRN